MWSPSQTTLASLSMLFPYHLNQNTSHPVDTSNAHYYFGLFSHFYTHGGLCFPTLLHLSSSRKRQDHLTTSRQMTDWRDMCYWGMKNSLADVNSQALTLAAAIMGVLAEMEAPQMEGTSHADLAHWRTAASERSTNSSLTLCAQEMTSYYAKPLRFWCHLSRWYNIAYSYWYTISQDLWSLLWRDSFSLSLKSHMEKFLFSQMMVYNCFAGRISSIEKALW